MNKRNFYTGLGIIFLASIVTILLIPASDFMRGMFSIPCIGALCSALFKIIMDNSEFERSKHLQFDEQIFNLGASSHMSSTAFDKHVEFCEAYMEAVHDAVAALFKKGPTEDAVSHANRLFDIKRKFTAWIPIGMALKLEPFESALYSIGVDTNLASALLHSPDPDGDGQKALKAAYATLGKILQLDPLKEGSQRTSNDVAIENVKEQIRLILGINEIVEIRSFIVSRSVKFARENSISAPDKTHK